MQNKFLAKAPHAIPSPYLLPRGALGNRLIFVLTSGVVGNVVLYLVIHRNNLYF